MYNECTFRVRHRNKNSISWACVVKSCKATLLTSKEFSFISLGCHQHNHTPSSNKPLESEPSPPTQVNVNHELDQPLYYDSNRGGQALKYKDFVYTWHKKSSCSKRWRCRKTKTCKAAILTTFENGKERVLKMIGEHNHQPQTAVEKEYESARRDLKRKVREEEIGRPSKKICQRVKGVESHFNMNDFKCLSQSMLREKKKKNPNRVPRNRKETIDYLMSSVSGPFTIKCNHESEVVLLFNPVILNVLKESTHLYADGTFQCAPKFFNQMYTFSILDNGFYIPFMYFLLPDKKTSTYISLLHMLNDVTSHVLKLKGITLDFEISMIKAIRCVLPHLEIHCCRFHLGQAWMRQIGKKGLLHIFYDKENVFGLWLKSLFVLPAISWERVTEFYYEHRENLDLSQIRNSADRKKFNQYLKYLEKYYVGSNRSNFPPRTWAGLIDKADIRYSNNGLESFHSHFKNVFMGKNKSPNIFELLHALDHFNTLNIVKLQSEKSLPPCHFSSFKDEHNRLLNKEISISQFLKIVSKNHVLPLTYNSNAN